MPDFTIKRYLKLLKSLQSGGFTFLPFTSFLHQTENCQRFVIFRHDVDALPLNALKHARLEHSLGIMGTYYFRMVPGSYDKTVIREIASLGHEIGYHYETLATIGKKGTKRLWEKENEGLREIVTKELRNTEAERQKGGDLGSMENEEMLDRAFGLFVKNLEKMRKIVPVETICMHGSPLSRFDNRDIWKKYDYRELGIIGEASMDIDFSKVAYYTDTGRRWDGAEVSIRDKVNSGRRDSETKGLRDEKTKGRRDVETKGWRDEETEGRRDKSTEGNTGDRLSINGNQVISGAQPETNFKEKNFPLYHSTFEIIRAVDEGTFPEQAMLTIHPQRWNDAFIPWAKELVWQNIKNSVKWGMVQWKQNSYLTYLIF